jgi:hypothetical protein
LIAKLGRGRHREDVQRHRHGVGRQLQVNVAVAAIEQDLALIEPRALDEPQLDRLAGDPDGPLVIIFVIVAPIARALVTDGQEAEIVIVRQAVEEWRRAAVRDHAVLGGRPDVGAQQIFLRGSVEHDHLGAVLADPGLGGAILLELLDDQIAEEAPVVGEAAQGLAISAETLLVLRIEASGLERLDQVAELDPRVGLRLDQARHCSVS